MTTEPQVIGKLNHGVQLPVISADVSQAETFDVAFDVQSDSILVTVFAETNAGDLNVEVFAFTEGGPRKPGIQTQEASIIQFPTITGPTTNLLLETAAATTSKVRVKASCTAAAKFYVTARAINGGTSTTRVVTAGAAITDQKIVDAGIPQLIIPPTLITGIGFILKNWSQAGQVIYISEQSAKANPTVGYPISPGGNVAVSVKGGQAWYASASADGADLRILEGEG